MSEPTNTLQLVVGGKMADSDKATTIGTTTIATAPQGSICSESNGPPPTGVIQVGWKLPAVLAGPIVRRAEPEAIHIWICLSTPTSIVATIFTGLDPKKENILSKKNCTRTTPFCTKDGRLHAALVCVTPVGATFPLDTVLHYTMDFTSVAPVFIGKAAFMTNELAYGDSIYPALILPGDQTPIVVMQTSCRKLHGEDQDAMLEADKYMKSKAHDVNSRVQQLIFTGDQIYADDVDASVLHLAQALGPVLLGFEETIEVYHRGTWSAKTCSKIEGGMKEDQRGHLVHAAGFTSDSCDNQLMAFHDFATMYLLGWSGHVWSFAKTNYADLLKGAGRHAGPAHLSSKITGSLHPEAIQRLMANVPTYMMCDDHDVTDDWNIDGLFQTHVYKSPLLRRVVLNALASFWLFQAWGNDPLPVKTSQRDGGRRPTSQPLDEVSLHLKRGAPGERDSKATRLTESFLPVPEGASDGAYHWRFITPKPASVIMLDTRTQRKFGSPTESKKPAQLMNEDALAWLRSALSTSSGDARQLPAIIASPPPVFGYHAMEWLQRAASSSSLEKLDLPRFGLLGFYAADDESWVANERGFHNFLATLDSPHADGRGRRLIILAGDVHYSCTAIFQFKVNRGEQLMKLGGNLVNDATQVIHLTASAAKNHVSEDKMRAIEECNVNSESGSYRTADDGVVSASTPAANSVAFAKWVLPMNGESQTVVARNNVGVLVIDRSNPLDPNILNTYVGEGGISYDGSPYRPGGTRGSWSALMGTRPDIPRRKPDL